MTHCTFNSVTQYPVTVQAPQAAVANRATEVSKTITFRQQSEVYEIWTADSVAVVSPLGAVLREGAHALLDLVTCPIAHSICFCI